MTDEEWRARVLAFIAKWCNPVAIKEIAKEHDNTTERMRVFKEDMERVMEAKDGQETIPENSRSSERFT